MYAFSRRSSQRLRSCDLDLVRVFDEVIRHVDCTVTDGHRGRLRQNRLHAIGASQLRWPASKHNSEPSRAVDVYPYPLPAWDDAPAFIEFGGFVLGIAAGLGVPLCWGGHWEGFRDYGHFELED